MESKHIILKSGRKIKRYKAVCIECKEFKNSWALSNLRPFWVGDNLSKGAEYA